jgi:RNA polymerase sigma-70 factor (ECF subfamily)
MVIDQSQLSDEQIIGQVLAGRSELYEMLVKKYWRLAVATALGREHDPAAAEDIAQDSFVRAYGHLAGLRDRKRFAGWLMKIVQQERITHFRRRLQHQKIESLEPARLQFFAAATNPGLSGEQVSFVHEAIGNLPEKFRTVVLMRFVGGLSVEQIADQLEKKQITVRVWLHRAYNTLRKELAPILEEVQK